MRLTLLNNDLNYFTDLIHRIHDHQVNILIPYYIRSDTSLIEVVDYYFTLYQKESDHYSLSLNFTIENNFVNTATTYYGHPCSGGYSLLSTDKTFEFIYGNRSEQERIQLNNQIFDKYFDSFESFQSFNNLVNPLLKEILEDIT